MKNVKTGFVLNIGFARLVHRSCNIKIIVDFYGKSKTKLSSLCLEAQKNTHLFHMNVNQKKRTCGRKQTPVSLSFLLFLTWTSKRYGSLLYFHDLNHHLLLSNVKFSLWVCPGSSLSYFTDEACKPSLPCCWVYKTIVMESSLTPGPHRKLPC